MKKKVREIKRRCINGRVEYYFVDTDKKIPKKYCATPKQIEEFLIKFAKLLIDYCDNTTAYDKEKL